MQGGINLSERELIFFVFIRKTDYVTIYVIQLPVKEVVTGTYILSQSQVHGVSGGNRVSGDIRFKDG